MSDVVALVAATLKQHFLWANTNRCDCGVHLGGTSDYEAHIAHRHHLAAAVVASLDLTEETRTLADGMGGVSTNYKTGETTTHSRPCTRQSRWVSSWVGEKPGEGQEP